MAALKHLISDPRVWTALLAFAQTILFVLVPNFPQAIWQSFDALAVIIIGALTATQMTAIKAGLHPYTLAKL